MGLQRDRRGQIAIFFPEVQCDNIYMPLNPFDSTCFSLVVNKPNKIVVIGEDKKLKIQNTSKINFLVDHRSGDGSDLPQTIGKIFKLMKTPELILKSREKH